MPDTAAKPALQPGETVAKAAAVSMWEIFLEFLIIGATSFGGVVPYLRGSLVTKRHWLDDKELVEMLSISQSLPGLNATNMAVLVGEKLRGVMGSIAGIIGICLPGGLLMFAVGTRVVRAFWPNPVASRRHDGIMDNRVKSFRKQDPFIVGYVLESQSIVLDGRMVLR